MTNVVTNEPPQAPTIAAVVRRLQQRIDELPVTLAHRRSFAAAYRRTMIAVEEALDRARFEDPAWVERWDVTFADLFLEAHDSDRQGRTDDVPRPWRLAFAAPATLPAQRHVLLAMNAHVNYDLPQALLAVITDDDFGDPAIIGRRMRDHERFDAVLASRLSASDNHDKTRGTIDRLRAPLDRRRAQRMLTEAREPVWHNTTSLQRAPSGERHAIPRAARGARAAHRREGDRATRALDGDTPARRVKCKQRVRRAAAAP